MMVLSVFVLFLLLSSIGGAASGMDWIHGSSFKAQLYDEHGRERMFHGVNHVHKEFPWFSPILRNESYIVEMAAVGVNVVRFGFMWSGAEPAQGQFNETYYEIVEEIVNTLAKYDIYTLFDMHQDGLSSKFCLYDGIPLWVADRSTPRHAFPWPLTGGCSRPWSENEITEACGQAYDDLYHNVEGMRDAYVKFWSYSARYFANNSNIIGYELINEPFAGDIYKKPQLLLPGVAGKENLQLLYDSVVPAIKENDKNHLIFYEPVTWGMIFNNTIVGSGFEHVPGGEENKNMSVLSFHYYCWMYDIPGDPTTFKKVVCDDFLGPQVFDAVRNDIATLGGSSFLTEFGATTCDPSQGNATQCKFILDQCDSHKVSWIHWPTDEDYKNDVYSWQKYASTGFTRPYASAVAGDVDSIHFDDSTLTYQICFNLNRVSPQQQTVIRFDTIFTYNVSTLIINTTGPIKVVSRSPTHAFVQASASQGYACVHLSPQ
eukprot:m.71469 g.71469  ORF g.71469 m.71469 type:complete len:487 (+) comp8350_c0_seq1:211-1671(+)